MSVEKETCALCGIEPDNDRSVYTCSKCGKYACSNCCSVTEDRIVFCAKCDLDEAVSGGPETTEVLALKKDH